MTKAVLIAVIADKLKFPWARAELLVEEIFDCMEQSMSRVEKIEIRALEPSRSKLPGIQGTQPTHRPDRRRRPKRLPHFKVSTELAARVNKGRRSTQAAAAESIKPRAPLRQ